MTNTSANKPFCAMWGKVIASAFVRYSTLVRAESSLFSIYFLLEL